MRRAYRKTKAVDDGSVDTLNCKGVIKSVPVKNKKHGIKERDEGKSIFQPNAEATLSFGILHSSLTTARDSCQRLACSWTRPDDIK